MALDSKVAGSASKLLVRRIIHVSSGGSSKVLSKAFDAASPMRLAFEITATLPKPNTEP